MQLPLDEAQRVDVAPAHLAAQGDLDGCGVEVLRLVDDELHLRAPEPVGIETYCQEPTKSAATPGSAILTPALPAASLRGQFFDLQIDFGSVVCGTDHGQPIFAACDVRGDAASGATKFGIAGRTVGGIFLPTKSSSTTSHASSKEAVT